MVRSGAGFHIGPFGSPALSCEPVCRQARADALANPRIAKVPVSAFARRDASAATYGRPPRVMY